MSIVEQQSLTSHDLVTEAEMLLGLSSGALTSLTWLPDVLVVGVCVALAVVAAFATSWGLRLLLGAPVPEAATPSIWAARWQPAIPALAGKLVAGLCLWAGMSLVQQDGTARPLLVLVLGGVVAWTAFAVARLAAMRLGVSLAIGIGFLLLTLIMLLGSLGPVRSALDGVGLNVGQRLITPLDVLGGVLLGLALFGLARVAIRSLERWVSRVPGLQPANVVLLTKIGGLAIIAVVVLIGIDFMGLDLTALKFFSGALGLAVGFGLQKTFGNLIAGLILLMDRSIKPGDVIVVGDTVGWVNRIGVRAVSVLTRDGKEHLIPNELLMTERVENWSYSDSRVRVHIPVGVSYDSDIAQVEALLLEAAMIAPRVLRDPAPTCWLDSFGDSSVNFDLIVWIADPDQGTGNVRSEILKEIWHSFARHGVTIPFPQRDVRVMMAPAARQRADDVIET